MDLYQLSKKVLQTPRVIKFVNERVQALGLEPQNEQAVRELLRKFMQEIIKLTDEKFGKETAPLDGEVFSNWRIGWSLEVDDLLTRTAASVLRDGYAQEVAQKGPGIDQTQALLASLATIAATLTGVVRVGATAEQYYDA